MDEPYLWSKRSLVRTAAWIQDPECRGFRMDDVKDTEGRDGSERLVKEH